MNRIGAILVTVVLGFGAAVYAPEKVGIIIHDQGPTVACEKVDTYDEALRVNANICNFTTEKWPDGGCSYKFTIFGEYIFQNQFDNAKTIHARGYNSKTDAIMVVRTDDEMFNKRTAYTLRQLIREINKEGQYTFCVTHAMADPGRKQDPHEYIPWLHKMGLIWDERFYPQRFEGALPEPRYDKWVDIWKE